jgi:hypothetical protein
MPKKTIRSSDIFENGVILDSNENSYKEEER